MKRRNTGGKSSGRRRKEAAAEDLVHAGGAELAAMADATDWARVEALGDDEIGRAIADDLDAAPILGEAFWRNAQVLDPRHGKTTITMRVDEDVLSFFKRGGSGYQSRMNAVLRAYVYARRQRVR
ncbi:MAG TPA: BrnA antitoxin family protein [Longimicrobiales bacterium]|nr:BrnA antitoxin family protein [Longimicrobiales bacterium]